MIEQAIQHIRKHAALYRKQQDTQTCIFEAARDEAIRLANDAWMLSVQARTASASEYFQFVDWYGEVFLSLALPYESYMEWRAQQQAA